MQDKGRIEQTTLIADIESVIGSKDNNSEWLYITGIVHTETEDIPMGKVFNHQGIKKYAKETSGFGIVSFMMGRGDFFYRLFPFRENLEVSLTTKVLNKGGEEIPSKTTVERFRAIYRDETNPTPQMSNDSNRTLEELNRQTHMELELELENLFEEPYRMISIDGTYSGTTQSILEAAATDRLNKIRVKGKPIIEAISVEPPHNTVPIPSIMIKAGLLVRDLPGWLQEFGKGVYSSGIGNFIDRYKNKVTWFVYPLFDGRERFKKDVEKLIIYFAPQDRYNGVENTFRKEGKLTYIVTTTTPPVSFTSFNADRNHGVGYRSTSPEAIMTKPADLSKGVRADPSRMMTQVVSRSRPDQMNYARVVGSSNNQFLEMSRIVKNQFAFAGISWDYADPNIIYPSMPCKCIFMNQGKYEERYGTVHGLLFVTRVVGNPMTSTRYKRDVELTIAMEPVDHKPKTETGAVFGDSR